MKRNLVLTAAALMLLPGLALAQQPDNDRGARPGGGERPAGGDRGPGQRPGGGQGQRPGGDQGQRPGGNQGQRPGGGQGPDGGAGQRPGGGNQGQRPDRPQIQPSRPNPGNGNYRPGGGDYRPGNGGYRPGNGGYRPRPFSYPQGYGYRRWQPGLILPSIFLGSSYYFSDYGAFGLGAPPRDYRWVRYGPDLVLVNVHNGRIRDVRYGVFG
ncbi:MAG: RcnB family protein [Janthinobacterium lividum]